MHDDDSPTGTKHPGASGSHSPDLAGRTIGLFRLLQKLGEGGMGEVYEAEQSAPVRRRVALKIIKRGMDTRHVVARFETERQALALMTHGAIARVFDAGETDEGRPYFVMELVRGVPFNQYCDGARLGTRERIDLFLQVCAGVQHAHQKGVIHRDLKPSNVLVTVQEGMPQVKIIDFGVAKATAQPLTEHSLFTELGQLIGTPEYMSPEQAEMNPSDIDTRTDVYALGVMLYQALCGSLPFDSRTLREAGFAEVQRVIREVDPPRPSTRVSSSGGLSGGLAARRGTDAVALVKRLRGDLDWITMKALEKDRTRRYGSPAELAADLRRHLQNEPVLAAAPSAVYRMRKFVKRHKAGVAMAAVAALALIAGIAGTTVGMLRARAERDRAQQAREEMEEVVGFLAGLFKVSDPGESLGERVSARQILDRGAERVATELQSRPLTRARMLETMGSVYESLGLYDVAEKQKREALAIRERELGPEHIEVAHSLDSLSTLDYARANFDSAERLSRRSLAIYRKRYGETHVDIARALSDVAVALSAKGDYEAAETQHREALEMARRIPDLGDRRLEAYVRRLANVLEDRGKSAEAGPLYQESLELSRRGYGAVHPQVAFALDNLALHFMAVGDLERAEPLFRESLAMLEKVYGREHPEVAQTIGNLADFLIYQKGPLPQGGQPAFAEAEALHLKALEMNRRIRPDHPFLGDNLNALAELRHIAKDDTRAETLVREALRIYRMKLSEAHPKAVDAKRRLGEILLALGRPREAEPLLLECHKALAADGDDSKALQAVRKNLADLYVALARPELAAKYGPGDAPVRP